MDYDPKAKLGTLSILADAVCRGSLEAVIHECQGGGSWTSHVFPLRITRGGGSVSGLSGI